MNEFDDIKPKPLEKLKPAKSIWDVPKELKPVEVKHGSKTPKLNVGDFWNIAKGFFRNKAVAIMEGKNVSILGFGIPNLTWVIAGVGLIIALYFLIR